MKEIYQLDSNTIDKIAAGEVVERPLSVVKELVENSIDAGSGAVTVEIKDGGISYIRVTDNGEGINKNEIKKAFSRHATSKIKSVEDLLSVSSLGFRGEALSSICAVAKVEMLTKSVDDIVGSRYVIEGSREQRFEPAGVPDGTTIIVRDLFYNTPARRKFLKSSQTEGTYIVELIEHLMLSNPDVSFKLIVNGNVKLQSSGNGEILDIIYNVYGRDISSNLIKIDADNGDVHIHGYIGKPELARANRNFEIYFVNNRLIKSSLISKALDESYKSYLMLHKYPLVFLFFDMPGFMIDVNVHPSKKEIRFIESDSIFPFLIDTLKNALAQKELIPAFSEDKTNKVVTNVINKESIIPEPFERARKEETASINRAFVISKAINENISDTSENNNKSNITSVINQVKENVINTYNDKNEIDNVHENALLGNTESEKNEFEENIFTEIINSQFLSEAALKQHRIIGQLFETYWLIEYDNKLYIVDQHAAHEKVKYERLIKQMSDHEVSSQMINPPVIVSLSNKEEDLLNKYIDNFKDIGFNVEHFGGHEYAISEVPLELYSIDPKEYFIEMLDEIEDGKISKAPDSVNMHIATMACKSAVKGNMKLSIKEADALISELLSLDNPYNCPHGRPTIVSYSKYDIEKMFKRIVN